MVVFLTVLKIFGIVIACILGLIILFVVLLMLIPFRYNADVYYQDKKMKAKANVVWEGRAVRVWYIQNEDSSHDGEVLLFGIRVMRLDTDSDWLDQQIKAAKEWALGIYHGVKEAPEGPIDRLKLIKSEMTGPKWKTAAEKLIERIKIIILEVFPKEGNGKITLGLEDPYDTGIVLEILAFLYPLYGKIFDVCPSFEEKAFKADLHLKGKVKAGIIVYHAERLLFSRRSHELYQEFMRLTHNE